MSKIDNLTKRLVILRLNSGKSLFLDPGKTSEEIPGAELKNNAMVQKLQDRRIIVISEPSKRNGRKRHPTKRPGQESPVLSTPETGTGTAKTRQKNKDKQKKPESKGGK